MFGVNTARKVITRFLGSQDSQQAEEKQEPTRTHTVAVDLTEDDDEGPLPRTKTTPPANRPNLPPRRPYVPPTGPRHQIYDPYPEPPPSRPPPPAHSHMTNPTKRKTDVEDELRLLGDYGTPSDAFIIRPPGQELQAPPRRGKPGAQHAFTPKNTISQKRYQGKAGVTGPPAHQNKHQGKAGGTGSAAQQKAGGRARHPNGLEFETSRGSNVHNHAQNHDFPDTDRPVKRPKTSDTRQRNGYTSSPAVQKFSSIMDANQREVSRPQPSPPARTTSRQGLPTWEVSGAQESRRVEQLMRRQRPEDRDRKPQQTNGRLHQANAKLPSQNPDVYEIIDDDEPTEAKKSMKEPNAKRRRISNDEKVEIAPAQKPNRHTERLSPWFESAGDKAAKKMAKSTDPIDLDAEHAPTQTDLKARMMGILGPASSSKQTDQRSVETSVGELDANTRKSSSLKRRSPAKTGPSSALVTEGLSDEEDELHGNGNIPSSFKNKKSTGAFANGPKAQRGKQSKPTESTWAVEEVVDEWGAVHNDDFRFLELVIHIGISGKLLRLREQGAETEDNLYVLLGSKVRGLQTSDDVDCRVLRIRHTGEKSTDIKFRDHTDLVDFVDALKNTITMKSGDVQLDRPREYMDKIYGKMRAARQPIDDPVDAGAEEALLNMRVNGNASNRTTTAGGRPREARQLLSQMRTYEKSGQEAAQDKAAPQPSKRSASRQTKHDDDAPVASTRPVRTTRARKQRSPTPDPKLNRYSKTVGLGKPWDQPITYPEVGKKRVTVDFTDLERLDEGEFLNDNLIEFYIRWLRETCPNVGTQTAYFFGTHFYTTLSDYKSAPKNARNRQINYQGVERWTAKDDIFSHDFVVVPINEAAHWYLAIICNLPNVQRKLESQGNEEVVEVSQEDAAKSTAARLVTISESVQARPITVHDSDEQEKMVEVPAEEKESDEAAKDGTPTKGIAKKCDDLALSSPQPVPSTEAKAPPEDAREEVTDKSTSGEGALAEAIEVADSQGAQQDISQISEGVFGNAAPPSPEKKKKGKRKSGPGLRKYETSQPAIVILDPMGTNHPGTITQLKHYLVEEASSKRGMELDKTMFQGINAHSGIPQQKNYYDCGVFVCGYLDKFMRDPVDFGQKLLTQEFDLEVDWPEMKPSKMREQMREMLQAIAKEQHKARLERLKAKRVAKKEAAAASSPPKVEDGVVDLSSPVKARDVVQDLKPVKEEGDEPREVEKARSRTSKSSSKRPPPPLAPRPVDDAEDVVLMQPTPDFTSQLQAAANQQDSQSSQRSYISESASEVERVPGGVKSPMRPLPEEFTIYEDPKIDFGDRAPSTAPQSPSKTKHYSPDLEL